MLGVIDDVEQLPWKLGQLFPYCIPYTMGRLVRRVVAHNDDSHLECVESELN